jgi:hypothetical protein
MNLKMYIGVLILIAFAMPTQASEATIRKSEKVSFSQQKSFKKEYQIDNKIKLSCYYRVKNFFKNKVIYAKATISNNSQKSVFFAYYVAFFDKNNNLVGSTGQYSLNDPIKKGEDFVTNTCIIPIPVSEIETITSFKLTLIVSNKAIGQ